MGFLDSWRKKDQKFKSNNNSHDETILENNNYAEDNASNISSDNNDVDINNDIDDDLHINNKKMNNSRDVIMDKSTKTGKYGSHSSIDDSENEETYLPNIKLKHKVVTIINQKGGVGKSTTSINLSAALGKLGKKILLIDLDPQGNSTSGLGIDKNQLSHCVYDLLLNDYSINQVVIKDVVENVDVVPATINLAGAEIQLVNEIARENRLKDSILPIKNSYDYIFIDCPPSLGLLTVNALVAADMLLIPIQTEFYALEGVTKLLDSMKRVKTRLNKNLDIFGVLLTMYDGRTTLAKQVSREVRNYFKDLVFETYIPRTVKISEAPSYGMPINEYEPDCRGAEAYKKLAKEVISRG